MTQPTSPRRPRDAQTVAAPIRVSTYVYGRHDDAVIRQQDILHDWIAAQPGWQLSGQYVDVRPNRQAPRFALRRALAEARAGRYDVLLVHDLSRLTRRLGELADILHTLAGAGRAAFGHRAGGHLHLDRPPVRPHGRGLRRLRHRRASAAPRRAGQPATHQPQTPQP